MGQYLGSRMVMDAFGLEEDGVLGVPPKMCHRVATMTSAGDDLQSSTAPSVRTRLAFTREKKEKQ